MSLRRELDLHLMARRMLHRFEEDDYRRLITLAGGRANGTLRRITRDEAGRILLRLLVTCPQLVPVALRAVAAGGFLRRSERES